MLIPSVCKESELRVDCSEEKVLEQPPMVVVINVEPMLNLEEFEQLRPCGPNLGRYICPEPFYADVVDTPDE